MSLFLGSVFFFYMLMAVELIFLPVPSNASARQALRTDETSKNEVVRHVSALAVMFTVFALPLLWVCIPSVRPALLPISLLADAGWRFPVAAILVVTSSLFTLWSVLDLRSHSRAVADGGRDALVETGAFALCRHPGLAGLFVSLIGLVLGMASCLMLVGTIFYVVRMHGRVLVEERYLGEKFGSAFQEYARRVPRYVPRW